MPCGLPVSPMPANPWQLVFDPKYADKIKSCGISMLDSGLDLMEAGFNYLGIPQDTQNPEDFKKAYAMLTKVRKDVKVFSSSGYINDLAGGNICASVGWSGDMGIAAARAKAAKNKLKLTGHLEED